MLVWSNRRHEPAGINRGWTVFQHRGSSCFRLRRVPGERRRVAGKKRESSHHPDRVWGGDCLDGMAGTAPGENLPAGESVAKDRGPKTLLEGILGSSENDKVKERSAEEDHLDADRPFANNFVQDDLGISSHHELATGLTAVFQLTKKVEMFAEWDAFYPTGGLGSAAPRNYAVTGLVYFVTPDLQLDMRAGVGLNHAANDFLAGVGFAARY